MAIPHLLSQPPKPEPDKCSLPTLDPSGHVNYFDIQAAEPGAFVVPGIIDLEVYEPGSFTEFSWVYFKGDPMGGPSPGHPFEMPFDNRKTNFSIDLVHTKNVSKVVRQIMAPTNSTSFWNGGAPFGRRGNHSLVIPRLDRSCKYAYFGEMIYNWWVPEDMGSDSIFRLKLTTDDPPTTHLSGKLQFSCAGAPASSALRLQGWSRIDEIPREQVTCGVAVGSLLVLCVICRVLQLFRKSGRIALK